MFKVEKIQKVKQFESGKRTDQLLRNSPSFMKTRRRSLLKEERTRSSVLKSTNHSTFNQDYQ